MRSTTGNSVISATGRRGASVPQAGAKTAGITITAAAKIRFMMPSPVSTSLVEYGEITLPAAHSKL
jgi:predicted flavoprotein YhiN